MKKTKKELINEYSLSTIKRMISFAEEYTGDPIELDEHRDIPVFVVEMKRTLIKFAEELEAIDGQG
jgi:hypothetical protein